MAWPKQVPILTADDIIRATYESEDGTRCCLIGWLDRVFPNALSVPGVYAVRNRAIKSIYSVIEESAPVGTAISSFNDTRPKARVAEVWNEAMRRLGYTEVFEVAE